MTKQQDCRRATARALVVDWQSAEVTEALAADGVPSLLMKGPVIARLLYRDGAVRSYSDTDLLVPRDRIRAAAGALEGLGYVRADLDPDDVVHSSTWVRRSLSGGMVDLHRTLAGVIRPTTELWPALWAERRRISVGGREVDVLGFAGTALLLATHAQHHGVTSSKPREDLRRGVEQLDMSLWASAYQMAHHVGAREAFEAALRRQAPALADALGVPPDLRDDAVGAGPTSGLRLALSAGGPSAISRALARRVFPPAQYMRAVEGAAPGGRSLAAAHLRRWRRLRGRGR